MSPTKMMFRLLLVPLLFTNRPSVFHRFGQLARQAPQLPVFFLVRKGSSGLAFVLMDTPLILQGLGNLVQQPPELILLFLAQDASNPGPQNLALRGSLLENPPALRPQAHANDPIVL